MFKVLRFYSVIGSFYSDQILGFAFNSVSFLALIATMGDVNQAVERLLASNVQGQRLS